MRYGLLLVTVLFVGAIVLVVEDLHYTDPKVRTITETLTTRGTAHLPELLGPGPHCVLPTGTVVPLGEAGHIFGPGPVEASSHYNSHNYWFVAYRSDSQIVVHPFLDDTIPLANDDIICGTDLTLRREDSGSFRATSDKK